MGLAVFGGTVPFRYTAGFARMSSNNAWESNRPRRITAVSPYKLSINNWQTDRCVLQEA